MNVWSTEKNSIRCQSWYKDGWFGTKYYYTVGVFGEDDFTGSYPYIWPIFEKTIQYDPSDEEGFQRRSKEILEEADQILKEYRRRKAAEKSAREKERNDRQNLYNRMNQLAGCEK